MVVADRLLRDIGQHSIGPTEGDHCHLAEEDGDRRVHIARTGGGHHGRDRKQP